jgi:quercetin dioxygenase-like cupin family protein
MPRRPTRIVPAICVLALALVVGSSGGREKPDSQKPSIQRPDDLIWRDGPASLPPGAKIAILDGDPTKSGPFVMRIKLPDGYKIPPHTHPKSERVTVLSGSFHLGMGDRFDVKHAQELSPGTYGTWPAGMKHFVWVEGETIVQFHGDGPWTIDYLNPADDPRQRK